MKIKNKKWLVLGICILIPLLVGWIGGIFTSSSVGDWYLTLNKFSLNPPSWVFAPVWTLLFVLMGLSLYFVFIERKNIENRKIFLWLFGVQLILNLLWSVLFFGLRNPFYALIEIVVLWIFILLTLIYGFKINRKSGWLLVPYLVWVSFAIFLNFSIVKLN